MLQSPGNHLITVANSLIMLRNSLSRPSGYFSCLILFGIGLILSSCSYIGYKSEDPYVAKVFDKVYLLKDLKSQLPVGMTKPDSLARVNDILTRWVKKELLLKMAEENLDESQRDLSRELEEYRNSMLIHRYQQQLLNQKLDTVLTVSNFWFRSCC